MQFEMSGSEHDSESLHGGDPDPNRLAAAVCDAIDEVLFENGLECKYEGWSDEMLQSLRAFIYEHYDDHGEYESDYDPDATPSEEEDSFVEEDSSASEVKAKKPKRK